MSLIREVIQANEAQKKRVVTVLADMCGGLKGRTVAVLGLAFKSETDDVRESPSLTVVMELLAAGATVQAHDPQGAGNFSRLVDGVTYAESSYGALEGADAAVLMTEWNEYRSLDLDTMAQKMKGRVILDARNLLDPEMAREAGFSYRGTGRGA